MKRLMAFALVCLLVGAKAALGCRLWEPKPQQVSPNLTISVTHRELPVSGITVQIIPDEKETPLIAPVTDTRGIVVIRALPPGKYSILVSQRDVAAVSQWIEVVRVPDTTTRKELTFTWGDSSIQTRRVVGTFTGVSPAARESIVDGSEQERTAAYAPVRVTLQSAFKGDEYQAIVDSAGHFVFGEVADGTYVLRIPGNLQSAKGNVDDTALVVDVTAHAKRDAIRLWLWPKICDSKHMEFRLADTSKSE